MRRFHAIRKRSIWRLFSKFRFAAIFKAGNEAGFSPQRFTRSSPFSGCGILEAEILRVVAGLGVFEHDTVRIEGVAGDHRQTVVTLQVQARPVKGVCPLYRNPALAGNDLHSQLLLQIGVNGFLGNFRGQARHQFLQEIVDIQNEALSINRSYTPNHQQTASQRKTAFPGQRFIRGQRLEPKHLCDRMKLVPPRSFLKGLDAANRESGFVIDRLIDHLNTLAVDRLNISVFHKSGQRPANGIAGTIVNTDQCVFGRQQLSVKKFPVLYFIF